MSSVSCIDRLRAVSSHVVSCRESSGDARYCFYHQCIYIPTEVYIIYTLRILYIPDLYNYSDILELYDIYITASFLFNIQNEKTFFFLEFMDYIIGIEIVSFFFFFTY